MDNRSMFRVYYEFEIDGELHKGVESEAGWFLMTQSGEMLQHGPLEPIMGTREYKKIIPLFCTGLKDKHGKLIFEDDIVKMNAHVSCYHDEYAPITEIDIDFIGPVVVTASSGACIKNPRWTDNLVVGKHGRTGNLKTYKSISAYRTEIIGNIYENGDLLNNS
jgi:uncharacterized phage protein (TIGR01671 family)